MMKTVDNSPNAVGLMTAIRATGYSNIAAISDIVDNAVDAGATIIRINVETISKDVVFTIEDNGIGMDIETLDEACRLGSETKVDKNDLRLGKFGMGLITASTSFSKRLEIVSKFKGQPIVRAICDIDDIIAAEEFIKELGKVKGSEEVIKKHRDIFGRNQTGTLVKLSKCDRLTETNITKIKTKISNRLGQTFRKLIESNDVSFYVNNIPVPALDPLLNDISKTYSDAMYPIKLTTLEGEEKEFKVRVKLNIIPFMDGDKAKNNPFKPSQRKAGFYVLRNGREIAEAQRLSMYDSHPNFNRIRGEIVFLAEMDEFMGVNFTKNGINVHKSILSQLSSAIKPQLIAMKDIINEESKKRNEVVRHDISSDIINKNKKVLKSIQVKGSDGIINTDKILFEEANFGMYGPIFNPILVGRDVHIQWNIDHSFYQSLFINNKNAKIIKLVNFLVYSICSAELEMISQHKNNQTLIDNMRSSISQNLRSLLDAQGM